MKNILRYIPLFMCSLLLAASCNKDDDQPTEPQPKNELPAATQTGAHTFGCIVNDTTVWVAELFPSTLYIGTNNRTDLSGSYAPNTGYTRIAANRDYFDFDAFEYYVSERIYIEGYLQEDGMLDFADLYDHNNALYNNYITSGCVTYAPDSTYTNKVYTFRYHQPSFLWNI